MDISRRSKAKLIQAKGWLKKKSALAWKLVKEQFRWVALGITTITAYVTMLPVGAVVPPPAITLQDGTVIDFPYTDDMTGEDIGIWTNKERYTDNIARSEVYIAINVPTKQHVDFSTILNANYTVERLELLLPQQVVIGYDGVYEQSCEMVDMAQGSTTPDMQEYCYDKKIGKTPIMGERYVPQDITFVVENQANDKVAKMTANNMQGTYYVKATLLFDWGATDKEFFFEAIGSKGGYGYLDPWFDSNWTYRKSITITGSGGAGTNYQVLLLIGESSGATGEDFDVANSDDFPAAKDDGGDLRFTDDDETTELDFWIEDVLGTTPNRLAYVWVEVADDLDSNTDIYIYYGNSGASNASNGTNTFPFFDEFDTYDSGEWEKQSGLSTPTVSGGEITITDASASPSGYLHNDTTSVSGGASLRTKFKQTQNYNGYDLPIFGLVPQGSDTNCTDEANRVSWWTRRYTDQVAIQRKDDADSAAENYEAAPSADIPLNTYYVLDIHGSGEYYVRGEILLESDYSLYELTEKGSGWSTGVASTTVDRYVCLGGNAFQSVHDWALVRKATSTEPAFSSVGSEEEDTGGGATTNYQDILWFI